MMVSYDSDVLYLKSYRQTNPSVNKFLSLFDKKIIIPAYAFVLAPFGAYLLWELYWCISVGYPFIKWHTHLMPFIYLILADLFILRFLSKKAYSPTFKNILLLCISVLLALFIAESFLSVTGINKTYMEQINGNYVSPYTPQDKSHYHVWTPGKPHWITKPEYSFWRPTNSLGFADEEWRISKKPKEKRLLALGDSFTEGDGAAYDSNYVSLLRTKLNTTEDSFYVMNAGVCGSDPFNNFIILRDLLLAYKPDVIIQSLGSGDMNADIMLRGGMERFISDGSLKYRPAPWWEPIYAMSYISRIFFKKMGYNEMLRHDGQTQAETERVEKSTRELFALYAELCKKNGITCVVVLHPERNEIQSNKYNYEFSPLVRYLSSDLHIQVVDLLPSYQSYIKSAHASDADYFWSRDGHHNSLGYKMMAETTFDNIWPMISDTISPQNK
jgi:lysophospholipase L1-like esterase